jgi:hypothetical protein
MQGSANQYARDAWNIKAKSGKKSLNYLLILATAAVHTVEPGYNDISLYDTLPVQSDFV